MTAPLRLLSADMLAVALDAQEAARWRVWTTDLLTGRQLSFQLPMLIDSYSREINGAGSFSGTVSLDAEDDPVPLLQPRRTALWVARDDSLRWGGIVWPVTPDIGNRTMAVSASSFLSYFDRREIRDTLTFAQDDQLDIFRALIDYAQSAPGGNIRVEVSGELSGVLRDRTYDGSEVKKLGEALSELAQVENGFEYAEDFYFDETGQPVAVIRLGYPHLGTEDTGLVFAYPGNVTAYSWPSDPANSANSMMAIGAGEGSAMLRSIANDDAELAAGYPLLESSVSYKDISVQASLDGHAREDLSAQLGDAITPQLTVRTGAVDGPALGDWGMGDHVRVMLTSPYHRPRADGSAGYDGMLRIVAEEVHPGHDDQDESAVLSCDTIRGF